MFSLAGHTHYQCQYCAMLSVLRSERSGTGANKLMFSFAAHTHYTAPCCCQYRGQNGHERALTMHEVAGRASRDQGVFDSPADTVTAGLRPTAAPAVGR